MCLRCCESLEVRVNAFFEGDGLGFGEDRFQFLDVLRDQSGEHTEPILAFVIGEQCAAGDEGLE